MNTSHEFNYTKEILDVSRNLGIPCELLSKTKGVQFINSVFEKFSPNKKTGHLAIHHDSISIPLELYEFSYSSFLEKEPAYIFFDQEGLDKGNVIVVENGKEIGQIMENAFGMEYFVSNKEMDYLLAVNWHVIEGIGKAKEWLAKIIH